MRFRGRTFHLSTPCWVHGDGLLFRIDVRPRPQITEQVWFANQDHRNLTPKGTERSANVVGIQQDSCLLSFAARAGPRSRPDKCRRASLPGEPYFFGQNRRFSTRSSL